MHKDSIAIHGGLFKDETTNAIAPPIFLSTTFERDEYGTAGAKGFVYNRLDNPNRKALEEKLALLEEGAEAFAFSSGLSACFSIIHSVLEPGMHFLLPDDGYHGLIAMVKKVLVRWNIEFTETDMSDIAEVKKAIKKNTRLIIIESPSNPLLKITDIKTVSSIAKENNIIVACDGTLTTACLQSPLSMGADIVFHSSTKFFGGHSDILGGCVIVKEQNELSARLREFQQYAGAVPSPFDCWLLFRSLSTLPLRIKKQVENAALVVEFLKNHSLIEKVYYPGLSGHPNHAIAMQQMQNGYGSMLSVLVKGGKENAMAFANNLSLFKHATSLGGVESLVEHRRSVEGDSPRSADNLLRFSIGIEDATDLISDLGNSLKLLQDTILKNV